MKLPFRRQWSGKQEDERELSLFLSAHTQPTPAVDPWAPDAVDSAPAPPAAAPPVAPAADPAPAAPRAAEPAPAASTESVAVAPPGPVDLPSNAPTIGRAGGTHLGRVNPATTLRPPAVSLDGTTAGAFQVAAASFIGTGHLQSGYPRQDAYNFMVGRSGRLYVAIADGLGSKPASQLGAHLFTESVLVAAAHAEEDEAGVDPAPAKLLARASTRTAQMVTETYQLDPRTVGFVGAVAVFSDQGCSIARVGDVSAFTLADGDFSEVFAADAGLVNIVSAAMPGEQEAEVETVRVSAAVPVLAFGTDGLANDVRNSGTLREWLAAQWRVPHLPFAMGDTLRYRRQGSHDDRTAVVVWRTDAGEPEAAGDEE